MNLATLTRAFRELGHHHQDQNNEVLQVVEVEAILSKIYHNACEEGLGGYNYSLVTITILSLMIIRSIHMCVCVWFITASIMGNQQTHEETS